MASAALPGSAAAADTGLGPVAKPVGNAVTKVRAAVPPAPKAPPAAKAPAAPVQAPAPPSPQPRVAPHPPKPAAPAAPAQAPTAPKPPAVAPPAAPAAAKPPPVAQAVTDKADDLAATLTPPAPPADLPKLPSAPPVERATEALTGAVGGGNDDDVPVVGLPVEIPTAERISGRVNALGSLGGDDDQPLSAVPVVRDAMDRLRTAVAPAMAPVPDLGGLVPPSLRGLIPPAAPSGLLPPVDLSRLAPTGAGPVGDTLASLLGTATGPGPGGSDLADVLGSLLRTPVGEFDQAASRLLGSTGTLPTPVRNLGADSMPAPTVAGPAPPAPMAATTGLGSGSSPDAGAPAAASPGAAGASSPRTADSLRQGFFANPPAGAADPSAGAIDAPVRNGEGPAPRTPDVPAPSSGVATVSSALFSAGLAVLLGAMLLLLAGQTRRFFAAPAFLRPAPFISLLERPG